MTVMSAVATRFMLSQSPWQHSAVPTFTLERRRHANKPRAPNGHQLTDCDEQEILKIREWCKAATLLYNCNITLKDGCCCLLFTQINAGGRQSKRRGFGLAIMCG